MKQTETPTLKDVAEHARVSFKTVSNVVNNRSSEVSVETRERVLESISALNYRPNVAARHLRKGQSGVLALAIPDLINPYFAALSTAVVEAAEAHQYAMLIEHTGGRRAREVLIASGFSRHLLDGVILNPISLEIEDLADINVPIVLLGERLLSAPYDHVVIDNVAAARLAMQHLLGLGRRRIAAVDLWEERGDTPRLRLRGYTEALTQAGLVIDQSLIVSTLTTRHGRMEGIEAMRRLLTLDRPPDAVLCFNDLVALGAMRVLQDAGYRVPDDVAVVGFDDIEEGRYAAPRLTTIAPDKIEIGRLAVSMLLGRVNGSRTVPLERVQPPFQLVVRESTVGPTGAAYP